MAIDISVHLPNAFICDHWHQLLPDWVVPVLSILIVLQHCPVSLRTKTPETEVHKRRLREQFLQLGQQIVGRLQEMGYHADLFDPRTGQPVFSPPGSLALDDVAVVQDALGYPAIQAGGCWLINHPLWGAAVFPSVIVSSAEPEVTAKIAKGLIANDAFERGNANA
jgi:hypothetical protein